MQFANKKVLVAMLVLVSLFAVVLGTSRVKPCQYTCKNNRCPSTWKPVCGSDGKTYRNDCEMRAESCRTKRHIAVQYQGQCDCDKPGKNVRGRRY